MNGIQISLSCTFCYISTLFFDSVINSWASYLTLRFHFFNNKMHYDASYVLYLIIQVIKYI